MADMVTSWRYNPANPLALVHPSGRLRIIRRELREGNRVYATAWTLFDFSDLPGLRDEADDYEPRRWTFDSLEAAMRHAETL